VPAITISTSAETYRRHTISMGHDFHGVFKRAGEGREIPYLSSPPLRVFPTSVMAKRLVQLFHPHLKELSLVLVIICANAGLSVVVPFLMKASLDQAIQLKDHSLLTFYCVLMFAVPCFISLLTAAQSALNSRVAQKVLLELRSKLYLSFQSMSLGFYASVKLGDLQSRLINDIGGVQTVLTNSAANAVANLVALLATVVAMAYISPGLTFICVSCLPVVLIMTHVVGKARRNLSRQRQTLLGQLCSISQEMLSVGGAVLVKTFGRQAHESRRFAEQSLCLSNLEIKQQSIGRWGAVCFTAVFTSIPAVVYFVGGRQIIDAGPGFYTKMTVGTLVAFTALQSRFFVPSGQLLNSYIEFQSVLALFERVFQGMDLPIEVPEKPDAVDLPMASVGAAVSFENVSFSYGGSSVYLSGFLDGKKTGAKDRVVPASNLTDVSFSILPGQVVAIVGKSGAGKTTIAHLICRFYDVNRGIVKIDGVDVRDLKVSVIIEVVFVVSQDVFLLNGTIRENLLYAQPKATVDEMIAATSAAAIHQSIMKFDANYDTVVGERGINLSGGERQRIAIARAFLRNPRFLILDEAFSSLDQQADKFVNEALVRLQKGRTTLIISHRLEGIVNADTIFFVENGRIIERGTHRDLISRSSSYAELYNSRANQEARPGAEARKVW
jgi:ATP-binding cassette subfamily B protein